MTAHTGCPTEAIGIDRIETPIGPVVARFAEHDGRLVVVELRLTGPDRAHDLSDQEHAAGCAVLRERLDAYFTRRDSRAFDGLRLVPRGTLFQQRVWNELRRIPFGETVTYGQLARRLGAPNAARAVGLANARNPIAIVIPCHRVLNSRGEPHGYAGGLERKRWLLEHEQGASRLFR